MLLAAPPRCRLPPNRALQAVVASTPRRVAPVCAQNGSVATLKERFDKLGRYGPRILSRRSVQMAPVRTGNHPACGRMVPAFFTVLPRRRGVARPNAGFGRSRHALAVGAALCAGVGAVPAETAQGNKRFLAGRRDVRPGERQMGVKRNIICKCRLFSQN